MADCA